MADHRRLSEFAFRLPVYVMADLLGIPEDRLAEATSWIAAFVQCLSPLSTARQIEDAKSAAGQLLDLVGSLSQPGRLSAESLLFALHKDRHGWVRSSRKSCLLMQSALCRRPMRRPQV
jgi:cytochrome P450